MEISVVIPAYNEAKYLGDCLRSLKKQTLQPLEIIVVNNNSTDQTVQIAKKYGATVIHEKKQGRAHARTTGFNAAEGRIIARTDADCQVPPNWIQQIVFNFQTQNPDAVAGLIDYYDLPISLLPLTKAYFMGMKVLQGGHETLSGANMALTKRIWQQVRGKLIQNDTQVHEDLDLARQISQTGGTIHRDNSLVVKTSARRIKEDPVSFFLEYPLRVAKSFRV